MLFYGTTLFYLLQECNELLVLLVPPISLESFNFATLGVLEELVMSNLSSTKQHA